ncbi:MAG: response regulator [Candidatus Eisenbacteria bacterium]|nr:response regulator [Candidatus Eisenbacteria bacterium]
MVAVAQGRVLIADDDANYLKTICRLLERAGYECDGVPDGSAALARLEKDAYDLLIADIRMPGNEHLELVDHTRRVVEGLPIILITGYPSEETARDAIGTSVVKYLEKPYDNQALIDAVGRSIARYRTAQAIRRSSERMREWSGEMEQLMHRIAEPEPDTARPLPLVEFIDLWLRSIMAALADLRHLTEGMLYSPDSSDVCRLMECPRLDNLTRKIRRTIDVLEETKGSFKSKALGDLRRDLETTLKEMGEL